jgi:hypothetical protein
MVAVAISSFIYLKYKLMRILKWYVRYFSYVLKHKFYVWYMCFKMWLYRQWIIHDLSKFLPCEAKRYMRYYSLGDKTIKESFDKARNHHQKNNKHHREYWVFWDTNTPIQMPEKYVKEMICDWRWVWRSFCKKENIEKYNQDLFFEVKDWYSKNKNRMNIHEKTRMYIENFLSI